MRVASLPMYDADPQAVDAWWAAISRALRARGLPDVPGALARPQELAAHWRDPRLVLSQTCGYPLVTGLAGDVQVVGAFRYTAPGCVGVEYRSHLVARLGDAESVEGFRGRAVAINSYDSHSGWNALRGLVAPLSRRGAFFGEEVITGSHRRSLAAVQSGSADIAAIDCVSLAALRRREPEALRGLQVVGSTALGPGLPLITAKTTRPDELEAIRAALRDACADPTVSEVREALFIDGFESLSVEAWALIEDVRRSVAPFRGCRQGHRRTAGTPCTGA